MQKRCGVVPTAVEPGPIVLLSQRLEWRENRARSTRPRDNHLAPECDRLTGESKAHNHADALAFSHSSQCLDQPVESRGSLASCCGRKACPIAHVFHVEHVSDG